MTPKQYRAAITELGLSQERAGLLCGYTGRAGQRWAALNGRGPPDAVAKLLRLMVAGAVSADEVEAA